MGWEGQRQQVRSSGSESLPQRRPQSRHDHNHPRPRLRRRNLPGRRQSLHGLQSLLQSRHACRHRSHHGHQNLHLPYSWHSDPHGLQGFCPASHIHCKSGSHCAHLPGSRRRQCPTPSADCPRPCEHQHEQHRQHELSLVLAAVTSTLLTRDIPACLNKSLRSCQPTLKGS